jgi:response regulator RpfG family c-di-GMP phosphodiesterase
MASADVDLVISDMRMPGMNGAQFLAQVKRQWPATMRILLTGYSEIGSTISAINDGGIHHYLSKPWEDRELLMIVAHALEEQQLRKRRWHWNARYTNRTCNWPTSTASWSARCRPAPRNCARPCCSWRAPRKRNRRPSSRCCTSSPTSANCAPAWPGQSARVARWCEQLALRMGMTAHHAKDTMMAGMLHGIGKLDLPDELVASPSKR